MRIPTMLVALCAALPAQQMIRGSRVIEGTVNYCADTGTTDAYACNLSPAITAYVTGACYTLRVNTANTGEATVNFNGLGAVPLLRANGSALETGDIVAGQLVTACYNGTAMQTSIVAATSGGTVGGTGTVGRVARFAGSTTTIADSVIRDDGNNVGIGTDVNASAGVTIRPTTNIAPLRVETSNGTARMVIDNSGRLGLGTTSPGAMLTVMGGMRVLNTDASPSITTERFQLGRMGPATNPLPYSVNQDTAYITYYYVTSLANARMLDIMVSGTSTAQSMIRFLTSGANTATAEALRIDGNQVATFSGPIVIPSSTPASASAPGATGQIAWDSNYLYVATGTNTWKRVALTSW